MAREGKSEESKRSWSEINPPKRRKFDKTLQAYGRVVAEISWLGTKFPAAEREATRKHLERRRNQERKKLLDMAGL